MHFPKLKADALLAPMAGVTDVAFRTLCRRYGAGLAVTEMISANALARKNKAALRLLQLEQDQPRAVQLFGQNTENIVKAARFLEDRCEVIDLNFGCPAAKIIRQGAGSALLERPAKIKEIVADAATAVQVPVTCKLRLGIRKEGINILETAEICEEAGAAMLTIHARTQKQGYTGKADWDWIKRVRERVSIPVAGNGDVCTVEDYLQMKKETGCDYVMIGRGAIGNPHIFRQIKGYNTTKEYSQEIDNKKAFLEYLELAKLHKIEFKYIKMQAIYFTKGKRNAAALRRELTKTKTIRQVMAIWNNQK